jgi:hypothetical protein
MSPRSDWARRGVDELSIAAIEQRYLCRHRSPAARSLTLVGFGLPLALRAQERRAATKGGHGAIGTVRILKPNDHARLAMSGSSGDL